MRLILSKGISQQTPKPQAAVSSTDQGGSFDSAPAYGPRVGGRAVPTASQTDASAVRRSNHRQAPAVRRFVSSATDRTFASGTIARRAGALSGPRDARPSAFATTCGVGRVTVEFPLYPRKRTSLSAIGTPLSAKIGNQTDRLAHSPGEPPAELAGRFETRTAPMVTFGAGDTGAVVDLASG